MNPQADVPADGVAESEGCRVTVSFRLLGGVDADLDGRPLGGLGHARQRLVLAALLLDANRAVTAEQLIDRVWADRPPQRARNTLYSCLSRLRQALAPARAEVGIERRHGGYLLAVDPETVDVHRFRRLVARAHAAGDDDRATALLEQALRLWRGEAFGGADTPWFNAQRDALAQDRLAAQLDLGDIRLRHGHHARMLAELSERAERHPLDERVAAQLMLALHRSGRPADALRHYEALRRRLAEELGTDPGAALQTLHQQILRGDPALAPPPPPASPSPATAAAPAARPPLAPRQLPAAPRAFVGRDSELAWLSETLASGGGQPGAVDIAVLTGAGGIGKSWLALRWAHLNLDRFPDGQLYAALRGFDPAGQPPTPGAVIRGFLDALGVPRTDIPRDEDAQAGLYRSLLAGRRVLVVLDNARDTAQVLPLLPGSAGCAVLVTSRSQLGGLAATHRARHLALDTLPDAEARQVLTHEIGPDRVSAEPQAVTTLLRRCAGLPLALGIVAARAATHPDFPLAALADELDDATTRLDALNAGDLTADLRAVFEASHRDLDDDAARLFALLGLAPGPDVSLPAAASLAGLPLPAARCLLTSLEAAHLVRQDEPNRFRMHDLIGLYAAERAHALPAGHRDAALHRLADFYLHTAHAGARLLYPNQDLPSLGRARPGVTPERPAGQAAALAWFTAERPVLLGVLETAISAGFDEHAWRLAGTLETFFDYQGHWHDWVDSQRSALQAARRLGDLPWQASTHLSLGRALTTRGDIEDGETHFHCALEMYERLADPVNQAHTHRGLGWVYALQDRNEDSLRHGVRALRLYRQAGHRPGMAMALNNVGWLHAVLGEYEQALDYCAQAVALNREIGNRHAEAGAWDSLGYAHHHLAHYAEAVRCYQRALGLVREFGDRDGEIQILHHLGDTHLAAGDRDAAERTWRECLSAAEEIGHPAAGKVRTELAGLTET